ncbi:hypothetical protein LCGC14_2300520, partial [marine sediment metagenome]
IKTVDEYRANISNKLKNSFGSQRTEVKYFVAGFVGAMSAARVEERKANQANTANAKSRSDD